MTNVFLEMKNTGAKKKRKTRGQQQIRTEQKSNPLNCQQDFPTVICSLILLRLECFRLLMSLTVEDAVSCRKFAFSSSAMFYLNSQPEVEILEILHVNPKQNAL